MKQPLTILQNLWPVWCLFKTNESLHLKPRGQLPEDKSKLLAIMDRYLSMSEPDRINYTLGKRLGYYRQMDDMKDDNRKAFVESKVLEVMELRSIPKFLQSQ